MAEDQAQLLSQLLQQHQELEELKAQELHQLLTAKTNASASLSAISVQVADRRKQIQDTKLSEYQKRRMPLPADYPFAPAWSCIRCGARYRAARVACYVCGTFAPWGVQQRAVNERL